MKGSINFELPNQVLELANYPIECFFRDSYQYGTCSNLHWHFYSEIIYVNDGAQEVTVGNNIVRINQGDLIYINPQQIHLSYSCKRGYTGLTVLKFDPDILKSALTSVLEQRILAPFLDQVSIQNLTFSKQQLEDSKIPTLLQEILAEQEQQKYGYEYSLRNKTCEVISCLMRELHKSDRVISSNNAISEKDLENFHKVMRYINDNFRSEISIEEILSICSLSYSNFAVKFRNLTGKTLTEYSNYVRISYAQQMLTTTSASVTEIANACGFNDGCYFSRVFKNLLGKSPYEFRKNAVLT